MSAQSVNETLPAWQGEHWTHSAHIHTVRILFVSNIPTTTITKTLMKRNGNKKKKRERTRAPKEKVSMLKLKIRPQKIAKNNNNNNLTSERDVVLVWDENICRADLYLALLHNIYTILKWQWIKKGKFAISQQQRKGCEMLKMSESLVCYLCTIWAYISTPKSNYFIFRIYLPPTLCLHLSHRCCRWRSYVHAFIHWKKAWFHVVNRRKW